MPYNIKKTKNKYYVFDNSNIQVPSHGFKTEKQARKQKIAVIYIISIKETETSSFLLFWLIIINLIIIYMYTFKVFTRKNKI
jgi:hypothetical protein